MLSEVAIQYTLCTFDFMIVYGMDFMKNNNTKSREKVAVAKNKNDPLEMYTVVMLLTQQVLAKVVVV